MNIETESLLIQAAQNDDTAAQEMLLQAHIPLIHLLASRLITDARMHEELTQAGTIGFLQALRKYDKSNQTRLITYAVPWILGEMRRVLRVYAHTTTCSLDEETGERSIALTERMGAEGIDLTRLDLRIAIEQLDEESKLLIYLRYFRDKTQKDAALLLGKSQSSICKLEQRILSHLRCVLS